MATILELLAKEVIKEAASIAAKANAEKIINIFKDIQSKSTETSSDESFLDIEALRVDFESYSDTYNAMQLKQLGKTTSDLWVPESMVYENVRINDQWYAFADAGKRYKSMCKNMSQSDLLNTLNDLFTTKK